MKSKRVLSLLMAALGSVSTSMAAKRANKAGNVPSSNALRYKRPGKLYKNGPGRRPMKRPGVKVNKARPAHVRTNKAPRTLNRTGVESIGQGTVEKNSAVSNGAQGGDQSTWGKMSDVEKGLTIGGSLAGVGVLVGGTVAVANREGISDWWTKKGNLSASKHNKDLCKQGAGIQGVNIGASGGGTNVLIPSAITIGTSTSNPQPTVPPPVMVSSGMSVNPLLPTHDQSNQKKGDLCKAWKSFKVQYNKDGKEKVEKYIIVKVKGQNDNNDKWYAVKGSVKDFIERCGSETLEGSKVKQMTFNIGNIPSNYLEKLADKVANDVGSGAEKEKKRVRYQLGLQEKQEAAGTITSTN